jgi:hypothetical protein
MTATHRLARLCRLDPAQARRELDALGDRAPSTLGVSARTVRRWRALVSERTTADELRAGRALLELERLGGWLDRHDDGSAWHVHATTHAYGPDLVRAIEQACGIRAELVAS